MSRLNSDDAGRHNAQDLAGSTIFTCRQLSHCQYGSPNEKVARNRRHVKQPIRTRKKNSPRSRVPCRASLPSSASWRGSRDSIHSRQFESTNDPEWDAVKICGFPRRGRRLPRGAAGTRRFLEPGRQSAGIQGIGQCAGLLESSSSNDVRAVLNVSQVPTCRFGGTPVTLCLSRTESVKASNESNLKLEELINFFFN